MRNSVLFFGSTILLLITSILTGNYFFHFSISQLDTTDFTLIKQPLDYRGIIFSNSSIYYIIGFTLLPTIVFLVKHYANIKTTVQTIFATIFILFMGSVLWYYKIHQLNQIIDQATDFYISAGNTTYVNINWFKFGKYVSSGFILGGLLIVAFGKTRMLTHR